LGGQGGGQWRPLPCQLVMLDLARMAISLTVY
jgi:hypothetical protein